MCGIAGIFGNSAQESDIQKMLSVLAHRGPDNTSSDQVSDQLAFGHQRLSIQDITDAGNQPMYSDDGNLVIVFNGEIYNQYEIKAKYFADTKFNGHSDTELLLKFYALKQEKILSELVGMWAMAIYNKTTKRLFLSRDRYGQKPLYYTVVDDNFYFASEIKALLPYQKVVKANNLAISEYLAIGNYEHLFEQTFFENIYSFAPASYTFLSKDNFDVVPSSYWDIKNHSFKSRQPLNDNNQQQFFDIVNDAVSSQMLSDVPVGATLSGGLDSSIIVSLMAQNSDQPLPIFTAQFEGNKEDETPYVKALMKRYGKKLEVLFTPVEEINLESRLSKVLLEQEEPFGDPSIIAHGYLMDAAKEQQVPVILGGQGGDEVSNGYSWMYQRVYANALSNGKLGMFTNFCVEEKLSAKEISRLVLSACLPNTELNLRIKARNGYKNWLNPNLQIPTPRESISTSSDFAGIYLESVKTMGIPHLTHYDDRSSMTRSIEGRMPFLDHRIMDFASGLNPQAFYSNGYSKWLFRKTFKSILPEEITARKDKVGFYTPVKRFIENEFKWVEKNINLHGSRFCKKEFLDTLLTKARNRDLSNQEALILFRVISVGLWSELFNVVHE